MSATRLDGDALAAVWRRAAASRVEALRSRGLSPCLASILVGDDPASAAYVGRKHADCAEVGIAARDIRLSDAISQADLIATARREAADPAVHGVLVQLPLPAGLDATAALMAVDPAKDVDGLHSTNLGRLVRGEPGLRPCTPQAVIGMLRAYDIPLAGRRVAVIGRGLLVGRALGLMLSAPGVDAVVTMLHREAGDLSRVTRESDIVICAAGAPGLITADRVRLGAAVIGVGISYVGGAMVSDIAEDVADVAAFVTPPHGSVGPLTRAMLLNNVIQAAEWATVTPPGTRPGSGFPG